MREMVATAHADLINAFIQEGSFRELTTNLYMEIGQRNDDGTIGRLFIADQRDPNTDLFYYAVDGSVISNSKGDFLVLNNGEVQRRDNQKGDVSIIKFGTYTFNLGEFTASDGTPTIFPKDRPLLYLMHPDANDPYYQRRPLQYTAEMHRRFTEWLYPIVFALIALAVAGDARSHRQARIYASFSAISLSLLVYWLGYFFGDRADSDLAYVPLLYILPLGISAFILFMFITNRKMSLPDKFNDKLNNISDWINRNLNSVHKAVMMEGRHDRLDSRTLLLYAVRKNYCIFSIGYICPRSFNGLYRKCWPACGSSGIFCFGCSHNVGASYTLYYAAAFSICSPIFSDGDIDFA